MRLMSSRQRRHKFNAVRTHSEICGRTFDSKKEAKRAEELKAMETAGEISDLQYQVLVLICPIPDTKTRIDFSYVKDGERVYEEVKGMETPEWKRNHKLMKQYGLEVLVT